MAATSRPGKPGAKPWAGNPVLANWDYLYKHPTKAEQLLEPYVAKLGIPYRFQHLVWRYIMDFALPTLKVDIELDGNEHYRSDRKKRDAERTQWLEKCGWKVVRIPDDDVFEDPERALKTALAKAGINLSN